MKIIKLVLLTSLLSISGIVAAESPPKTNLEVAPANIQKTKHDFRKWDWGMSIEEAKAAEQTPVYEEKENYLSYLTPMSATTLKTELFFVNNKLAKIESYVSKEMPEMTYYLALYDHLLKIYTKKLGKPKLSKRWSHVDIMEEFDRPERWIESLELGHAGLFAEYTTDRTVAVLILASPAIYFEDKHKGSDHILTVIMGDASLQEYPN